MCSRFLVASTSAELFKIFAEYLFLPPFRAFHNVLVGYHKAVKRIAGLCTWDRNHLTCENVGVNIFRPLRAERMFNFYLSIIKSENKSMMSLKC